MTVFLVVVVVFGCPAGAAACPPPPPAAAAAAVAARRARLGLLAGRSVSGAGGACRGSAVPAPACGSVRGGNCGGGAAEGAAGTAVLAFPLWWCGDGLLEEEPPPSPQEAAPAYGTAEVEEGVGASRQTRGHRGAIRGLQLHAASRRRPHARTSPMAGKRYIGPKNNR